MKKKCAIYARVSTAQGKQDYARQISELKGIASKDGYESKNIVIYADTISGYKFDDRDQLNKLLEEVRLDNSLYSCIYISEISRLGRNPKNTRNIIEELIEISVPIYIQSLNQLTIDEKGQRNSYISVILQVLLEVADMEATTFKLRSKSGRIQKVKEGKAGGGKYYPYGYKKDDKNYLVVEDEEAEVIKKIFDLYSEGYGIRAISQILNSEKIPTRSNKSFPDQEFNYATPKKGSKVVWSDKQIHDILRNTIYIGKRRFLGSTYDAPIIINEELFNTCNSLLKSKKNRNSYTDYVYLLKGIITCGVCGRNYTGRFKPKIKGEKVYKCSSTLIKFGSCTNKGVNIELIESMIFHIILNSNSAIKLISNQENLAKEISKDVKLLNSKLINIENDLTISINRNGKLVDMYLDGDIDIEKFHLKKDTFEIEINNHQKQIIILKRMISEKNHTLEEIKKPENAKIELIKQSTDRQQLQNIFHQLVNNIIVNYLTKDFLLITIYFKIGSEILKIPMKILIDVSFFRKKIKTINFKSLFQMEFEPYYRNGILDTDYDLIVEEFLSNINFLSDWEIISTDNVIKMKIPTNIAP